MTCILVLSYSTPMNAEHITCSAATKKTSIKKVYQAYNKFMKNKKYEKRMTKKELKIIREYKKTFKGNGVAYSVLDIDKNGVPELLVASGQRHLSYNSSGWYDIANPVHIFTYKKAKVTYIGKMEASEEALLEYTGAAYNSKTKKIWLYSSNEMQQYYFAYSYNGKSIKRSKIYHFESQEDYPTTTENMEKIRKLSGNELPLYENTEKSRKKHLTFQLNKTKVVLKKSKKIKLKVTGKLSGLKWSSSNSKVATVKNGTVTAKKAGKAVVKATLNGTTLKCKVTVVN